MFEAGEGAGRSGSFFFFSHDHKFIIKTMTNSELKLYLKLHDKLAEHHSKNENSLLIKILGVFTVKSGKMGAVHIMLMENGIRLRDESQLKYIFDLKGSRVDREVKGKTKNSTVLKDINYIKVKRTHAGLCLMKPFCRRKLIRAMKADV